MKRIIILAVALFIAVTFNTEAKRHYIGVSGYFYSQLSPYGSWIEVDYGVVVWRPTIIRVNWMPYQMGQWVWTYDGWYWDSYEPFGFITYHYGRWYFDDYYGWLWYPDYEWAPAWVEWRYDNDYIGWAPLNPYAVFSVSVGIYFTTTYYTPYNHWNYVSYRNFCDPYVYNYYVSSGSKYRIHSGTKYRNNFVYYNGRIQNRGVDVKYISVRSGKEIKQRDLIRVNDSKKLSRDGYRERDEIRTLELNRDELVRNDLGRMEIKRENRKTSIDMDKVQIGSREKVKTETRNDKSKERNQDVVKTDQNRNDVKNIINRVFDQNRTQSNRNDRENVNTQNDKVEKQNQNRETVSRNETQVKRQNNTKSDGSLNSSRNNREETVQLKQEKQKEVSKDETRQTKVRHQNDNKTDTNRSDEIKKSENKSNSNDNSKERKR
jgi:hypothetical protein